MFKKVRRQEKAIDNERTIELLKNGQFGILSTTGDDGYAYGVPINYVFHEGSIYFHSAIEGNKLDNIKYNNKVSFCVVGRTEPVPEKFSYRYESVIAFGQAEEVFDKEKEEALISLVQKYSIEFIEKGIEYIKRDNTKTKVIKINIEHIAGKSNY